jgi:hypothetical protein
MPPHDHNAFAEAVLGTVREASADVIRDGVATLEEGEDGGGRYLRLIPAAPVACEVTVYPDYPTLCLGEEGHTTEMFGRQEDRLRELRGLIAAVIAGRYEWEHRQVTRRLLFVPLYRFTRLVGTFHTTDGPWTFTRQGSEPPGVVERRSYAAYRQ